MSIRHLTILGATGTIGVNTLDVVARHPGRFNIVALSGNHQLDKLAEQCRVHSPRYAVVLDVASAARLREILKAMGSTTEVLWGIAALEQIAALLQSGYGDGGDRRRRRSAPGAGSSQSR